MSDSAGIVQATDQPPMPEPGQKLRGVLRFSHPMLTGWEWPFVVARGVAEGPRLALLSGVHAAEYPAIEANVRFMRDLDPGRLRGTIVSIPIVDPPAFYARSAFVCPLDGKNPNRCFPGDPDGTFSEAMDHFVFSSCIAPADALLDLHGGDLVEELAPFAIYAADAAPEVVARSRAMAEAFGLSYTIAQREDPGALAGMTYAAAGRQGIPGLIAEAGGIGQLTEPDVELLVQGARRALQVTGNLQGEPGSPGTTHLTRFDWLYSTRGGFWVADVRAGDAVRAGQRLG